MSVRHSIPAGVAGALSAEGGCVPFARFMELALTYPGEGYYSRGRFTLGRQGDFTTAPHRTKMFGRTLGRFLVESARSLLNSGETARVEVVEMGGGEGDLAVSLAAALSEQPASFLSAVSLRVEDVADHLTEENRSVLLGARRRGLTLALPEEPGCLAAVSPPAARSGDDSLESRPVRITVSNELVDALPVHIVDVRGAAVLERYTCLRRPPSAPAYLEDEWRPPSAAALSELWQLFGSDDPARLRLHTRDGILELRPAAEAYLGCALGAGARGLVVTIDYGEWLDGPGGQAGPEALGVPSSAVSHGSSLRCYFRHLKNTDPYVRVGEQDITADVDFRGLALHGERLGLEGMLFTSLADFLRGMGVEEEARELCARAQESLDLDVEASTVARLLDESDVGGLFKVLVQATD